MRYIIKKIKTYGSKRDTAKMKFLLQNRTALAMLVAHLSDVWCNFSPALTTLPLISSRSPVPRFSPHSAPRHTPSLYYYPCIPLRRHKLFRSISLKITSLNSNKQKIRMTLCTYVLNTVTVYLFSFLFLSDHKATLQLFDRIRWTNHEWIPTMRNNSNYP